MNASDSTVSSSVHLPPVAPDVVAAAVESLTSRLRKKLDEAIERYAATPVTSENGTIRVDCGDDAVVMLTPGPSGAVVDADSAVCSCLLAPRCLHRAAVLGACPLADADDLGAHGGTSADDSGEPTATSGAISSPAASGGEPAAGDRPETASPAAGTGSGAGASGSPGTVSPGTASPGSVSPGAAGIGAAASAMLDVTSGAAAVAGSGGAAGETTPVQVSATQAGTVQAGTVQAGTVQVSAAQVSAASGLWAAAAAALAAGVPAAGAVAQAELLRAAHTARLAGLHRAEAATLRVVRGLRSARARHDGHRLADLAAALRELLLITGRIAAAEPDPALIGVARRTYDQGGSLRVYGVCREPVISATGYGGVVTHVVTEDGRWFSVSDVKPGGSARARGAATATVAIGAATLNHAQLARGGLLIAGATVSPEGRLGAGRGVRATPLTGLAWSAGALARLFARPLTETVAARLAGLDWSDSGAAETLSEPVGCDLVIVGAAGDHVLARELTTASSEGMPSRGTPTEDTPSEDTPTGCTPTGCTPTGCTPTGCTPQEGISARDMPGGGVSEGDIGDMSVDGLAAVGPLIRLVPASSHPDLAHIDNLRQLASRPGLRVRVVGRLDPDRAATLRPVAVGSVPGAGPTLRLPAEWLGRADLGYDRLQGSHLPRRDECPPYAVDAECEMDPVAGSPLWRARRLVELAVAGGRRAVVESGRGDSRTQEASLRGAGFHTAAGLTATLTAEADRRDRDVFGRLVDSAPDRYAAAWLAAAVHLAATERALVQASWTSSW